MNGLVIRWVLTSVALWLTSRLVSGIVVDGVLPLVLAAIVLGFVNAIVRPLVLVLTLPFNILTLGLLTFVINGAMLKLTAGMVPGFRVEGFWSAVGGAITSGGRRRGRPGRGSYPDHERGGHGAEGKPAYA